MDAGKRHDIVGSETKDFVTYSKVEPKLPICASSLGPPSLAGVTQMGLESCLCMQWVVLRRETLNLEMHHFYSKK